MLPASPITAKINFSQFYLTKPLVEDISGQTIILLGTFSSYSQRQETGYYIPNHFKSEILSF